MEFKNDNAIKTNLNNLHKERQKINRSNNEKKACKSVNSFYLIAFSSLFRIFLKRLIRQILVYVSKHYSKNTTTAIPNRKSRANQIFG